MLPGATPMEAMRWLGTNGPAVEGVEEIRVRLQQMMDDAIAAMDGTHFDLAEPVRRVEAMIAPPGSAAAPYYTRPAQDFSRPGRTWLPTLGRTRFPLWDLVSIWYHEGVPGHHLQLAQWAYVSQQLSTYQTSLGRSARTSRAGRCTPSGSWTSSATSPTPVSGSASSTRQQLRSVRVVIDIGMHLGLPVPDDAEGTLAAHRGQPWTPELARAFLGENSGADLAFLDSELVRYLGIPGPGDQLQAGRAGLARGPGGGAAGPRCRLRPQGLAHGRALTGLAGARRPRRRAGAPVTGGGDRQAGDRRPTPGTGPTTAG